MSMVRHVRFACLLAAASVGLGAVPSDDSGAPRAVRFRQNPIIRPEMLPGGDGVNVCGPSAIRVPEWLPNPLGKYFLYFADHRGTYIRMAYADRVEGPWTVHAPGSLKLDDVVAAVADAAKGPNAASITGGHIASPDVHVDDAAREIRMYFHCRVSPNGIWGHRSGVARSKDGIHSWRIGTKSIGDAYLRVFKWGGHHYAIDRSAVLSRSLDGLGGFEAGNTAFAEAVNGRRSGTRAPTANPEIRHTALKLDGSVLTVFYSRMGDLPERLLCSRVALQGDWRDWRLSPPVQVLEPSMVYEGVNGEPRMPTNSEMRVLPRPMFRELRDPCILQENGRTFLLYSVAGERGIAGAILKDGP